MFLRRRRCSRVSRLTFSLVVLLHTFAVKVSEQRAHLCITINASLVDDTLGAVDVPFIAIEPIDTGLVGLLNDVLLDDHVVFAPVLDNITHELVLVEVDARISILAETPH